MVSATSIKTMFPEFKNLEDSYINLHIQNASLFVCSSSYGNRYDFVLSYLTAHFLKISKDLGKELASETVDKLSRTYKTSDSNANSFSTTSYGKVFEDMKKMTLKRIRPLYAN